MRVRRRQPLVPVPVSASALGGAVWWTVGSVALPVGFGTLVLAAGLLVAGGLIAAARRRTRDSGQVDPTIRRRVARSVMLGLVLVLAAVVGLNGSPYAELSTPVACMITGGWLVPLAGLLERRGYVLLGAALMVLGAVGALLALRSAGQLYPQGLVGMCAGVLLWLAAVVEARLHLDTLTRIGIR